MASFYYIYAAHKKGMIVYLHFCFLVNNIQHAGHASPVTEFPCNLLLLPFFVYLNGDGPLFLLSYFVVLGLQAEVGADDHTLVVTLSNFG